MAKCSKYHAKWQVLVLNCCKYMANGTKKESKTKQTSFFTLFCSPLNLVVNVEPPESLEPSYWHSWCSAPHRSCTRVSRPWANSSLTCMKLRCKTQSQPHLLEVESNWKTKAPSLTADKSTAEEHLRAGQGAAETVMECIASCQKTKWTVVKHSTACTACRQKQQWLGPNG